MAESMMMDELLKKTVQQLSTAKNQDFLPNNAVEKRGYFKTVHYNKN